MTKRPPLAALASFGSLKAILDVLREVDARPARVAAETPFTLLFASQDLPFAEHLVSLMYRGLRSHELPPHRAAIATSLEAAPALVKHVQWVGVLQRETDAPPPAVTRLQRECELAHIPCLPLLLREGTLSLSERLSTQAAYVPLRDGVLDEAEAVRAIISAVRAQRIADDLALARHLPAFREVVVRALIEEVAITNAVYSLGTGIFEVNPVTGLPLAVADVVVLTKNQALMVWKIALAMGMPADFRQVMPQLLGVIGGGLFFRQVARSLVGLLPGAGVLPKVAVAFAGTYAIGEAVYQWCAHEERLNRETLQLLWRRALAVGREAAQQLWRVRQSTRSSSRA